MCVSIPLTPCVKVQVANILLELTKKLIAFHARILTDPKLLPNYTWRIIALCANLFTEENNYHCTDEEWLVLYNLFVNASLQINVSHCYVDFLFLLVPVVL